MKLATYLKFHGLSKDAFAKAAGFSPEAVRLWCNGDRQPRPRTVDKIAEATCGEVTWLDWQPVRRTA